MLKWKEGSRGGLMAKRKYRIEKQLDAYFVVDIKDRESAHCTTLDEAKAWAEEREAKKDRRRRLWFVTGTLG